MTSGKPISLSQMCLRFNDVENVGLSGRHYTSFCMVGQTCNADLPGGYWKDECVEIDYGMLTDRSGNKAGRDYFCGRCVDGRQGHLVILWNILSEDLN